MTREEEPAGSVRATGRAMWQGLLELVYPATCWVCGEPMKSAAPLICTACTSALTIDPHATCPRCSSTVGPFVNLDAGCLACRDASFAFERSLRLGPYEGLLRDVVLRMKRPGGEDLAEVMARVCGQAIAERLRSERIDVVIPIPLHWWRRWERGFNPSEILAAGVARGLGVLHRPGWLRQVRRTAEQKGLSPTARRANVRDAFRATRAAGLAGKTVLLIDDVMTTGATAHEAARALRAGGAASVRLAVLAHSR